MYLPAREQEELVHMKASFRMLFFFVQLCNCVKVVPYVFLENVPHVFLGHVFFVGSVPHVYLHACGTCFCGKCIPHVFLGHVIVESVPHVFLERIWKNYSIKLLCRCVSLDVINNWLNRGVVSPLSEYIVTSSKRLVLSVNQLKFKPNCCI